MIKEKTIEDLILEQITPTQGIMTTWGNRTSHGTVGIKANQSMDKLLQIYWEHGNDEPYSINERAISSLSSIISTYNDLSAWVIKEF